MAKNKRKKKDNKEKKRRNRSFSEAQILLEEHYQDGTQEMDTRRTRRNGWNSTLKAFLNKLPKNWPYQSKVTDPRIRTTILEKTARLLNSKLKGTVSPREGGDQVGAKVNNAILSLQWDAADFGGSMIEKTSMVDTITRIFGNGYTLNYWDAIKEGNEMKVLDPRDVLVDPGATHIHNARWVQTREWMTKSDMETAGISTKNISFKKGDVRASAYESITKDLRGLEDRVGRDTKNPVIEVITEWVPFWATADNKGEKSIYLPQQKHVVSITPLPFKHGKVPLSQNRYYTIFDDLYGQSEVEPVMPLQRAINAILCGYLDTMNLATRPPIKVVTGQAKRSTIVFGPNAIWTVNRQDAAEEVKVGEGAITAFNNTYPMLIASFNTAMGDQSLGVSNVQGKAEDKTATEVNSLERQQFTRDQFNQLYLAEFLKDVTMQWLNNNQQFLLDDPTKRTQVVKIVGKEMIRELEEAGLAEEVQDDKLMEEVKEAIVAAEGDVSDEELKVIMEDMSMPKNAVIMNPEETDIDKIEIKPKLEIKNSEEAELIISESDFAGVYDYIPDVKSMAIGATRQQQEARKEALELAKDPTVQQMIAAEGKRFKMSELVVNVLEAADYKNADTLYEDIQQDPTGQGGQGINGPGALAPGLEGQQGVPGVPAPVPGGAVPGGVPIAG